MESEIFNEEVYAQLINLGRNNSSLLSKPSIHFFGLCETSTIISTAKSRSRGLRPQGLVAGFALDHAIIRHISRMKNNMHRHQHKDDSSDQLKVSECRNREIKSRTRKEQACSHGTVIIEDVFVSVGEQRGF